MKYEIRKTVRMVIRKLDGLVVAERPDSSRGANDDVIATDVTR